MGLTAEMRTDDAADGSWCLLQLGLIVVRFARCPCGATATEVTRSKCHCLRDGYAHAAVHATVVDGETHDHWDM